MEYFIILQLPYLAESIIAWGLCVISMEVYINKSCY